jgi:pimeloyl-ACP methyl ester carboxylesterase
VLLHGFPDDARIYDRLDRVVLVGHDAGPDAIDYAMGEPGRVEQLVLLNTSPAA